MSNNNNLIFQSFIDFSARIKIADNSCFIGNTFQEIALFELSQDLKLPDSLKNYLLFFGKKIQFYDGSSHELSQGFDYIKEATSTASKNDIVLRIQQIDSNLTGVIFCKYQIHRDIYYFLAQDKNNRINRYIFDYDEVLEDNSFVGDLVVFLYEIIIREARYYNQFKKTNFIDTTQIKWFEFMTETVKDENVTIYLNSYLLEFLFFIKNHILDFNDFESLIIDFLKFLIEKKNVSTDRNMFDLYK